MRRLQPFEEKMLDSLLADGVRILDQQEIFSTGALIRLLRLRLNMTQRQLSIRTAIPQSTIVRIEREKTKATEKTLRKIFSAMGCTLLLIPAPRTSVEDFMREKARKIAEKRLSYLEGTMALEKQRPEKKWREQLLESEIEKILHSPSQIWDEDDLS